MTVTQLIEILERLKEYDPEVEVAVRFGSQWAYQPVGEVVVYDGQATIYGKEEI